MDRAERWIAISDGGAGLEDWLETNFPRGLTMPHGGQRQPFGY